jgi:hypothetical protein
VDALLVSSNCHRASRQPLCGAAGYGRVDPARFAASFQPVRGFAPSTVLSTHLPPVTGDSGWLFETVLATPQADPFVGPDQAALEAMLREFKLA